MATAKKKESVGQVEQAYDKEQLLASQQFTAHEKDLLGAILKEGGYTIKQAQQALKEELERVIN